MIVIQFRKDLLHYSLTEQNRLCTYTKSITILPYCSHLTIIQIDNLSVTTHQRLLLLFQIFWIDICLSGLLLCHFRMIFDSKMQLK